MNAAALAQAPISPAAVAAPNQIAQSWDQSLAFKWIFIVLGGLPIFLPFVLWAGEGLLGQQDPVYWYYWMGAVFSAPHVYSTYLRLDRKIGEKRVHWLFGLPGYLGCVAALALSQKLGYFLVVMTAVNVWQTIHYARQGWGVNRFFSRGSGENDLDRRLLYWGFHLAFPLFVFGRWNTLYVVWRGLPSNVIIPVSFSGVFLDACWVLFFAGVGLALFGEARKISRRGLRSYDPIGLATIAAYFAVHAYGFLSVSHYQRGFFAVTIYHGMQYLALLWLLEKEVASRPQTAVDSGPSALAQLGQRIGLFLRRFPFMFFWVFIFAASLGWERYLSVRANVIWPMFSLVALSAVSAHHYLVDTVLWRTSAGK